MKQNFSVSNIGIRKTKIRCKDKTNLLLADGREPIQLAAKCKCPRVKGKKTCNWYAQKLGNSILDAAVLNEISCIGDIEISATDPPGLEGFEPLTNSIQSGLTHCSASENQLQTG